MGNPLTITFVIYIAAMVLIGFAAYHQNLSDYIRRRVRQRLSTVGAYSTGCSSPVACVCRPSSMAMP